MVMKIKIVRHRNSVVVQSTAKIINTISKLMMMKMMITIQNNNNKILIKKIIKNN